MPDAAPSTMLVEINTITILLLSVTITFIHWRHQYVTLKCIHYPLLIKWMSKDDDDPGINEYVSSGDCQATAIESTTTFVTTNVAIAAPYLGILNRNSENLTVKMYVLVL
jgi:hypothetical protein